MKEAAFRTAVHNQLPKKIHRQPMLAGEYGFAGTPDTYYDFNRDLWCEYKVIGSQDYLPTLIPEKSMPTTVQRKWLDRRFENGGNAICIVGIMLNNRSWGVVLENPEEWTVRPTKSWYEPRLLIARDIAAYIQKRVT